MNALPVSLGDCFHNGFTHGGVGVNRFDDFLAGDFLFACHDSFRDHFRYIFPDEVSAKPLPRLFIKDHLDKAVPGSGSSGFAGGCKREFPHQDLVPGFEGRFF